MMDQDHMRVNSCWRRVQACGLAVKMPHPEAGEVQLVASPIRLPKTPVEYRRAPPLVGEHTDEILADLGVDAAGIQHEKSLLQDRPNPRHKLTEILSMSNSSPV